MATKGDRVEQLVQIKPSQRWVRAQVGDEFVVDLYVDGELQERL